MNESLGRPDFSLRTRLLVGMLSIVAVIWLLSAFASYAQARRELGELLDAHLATSAALLVAQASEELEEIELEHLPDFGDAHQRLALQVWSDGRLGVHSANAPKRMAQAAGMRAPLDTAPIVAADAPRLDSVVSLSVCDDGPGIAAEDRARALQRFDRLDAHAASGAGLGLAIVQRIADAIGAQLSLSDGIDGTGLGVHLRIPQRLAPRPA